MAYLEWERFWSKVAPANVRGCRLWMGGERVGGYGSFLTGRRRVLAHRWAYASAKGQIPKGMAVLHKCDVHRCVSPDHLMLGTQAENNADRGAKGRSADHSGARCGMAKLSDAKVLEIRSVYAAGGVSHRALAKVYGVSESAIQRAANRKGWRHI